MFNIYKIRLKFYFGIFLSVGTVGGTMEEVMAYYERIGNRNRSPVWTKEDMNEVDYRSFIKGFITGSAILSTMGGVFYFLNRIT